jgi:hypothetical protein
MVIYVLEECAASMFRVEDRLIHIITQRRPQSKTAMILFLAYFPEFEKIKGGL